MTPPAAVLSLLAGLSSMARCVLLAAYMLADAQGEVRCLARSRWHGQGLPDFMRSVAELEDAGLCRYEMGPGDKRVLTLVVWARRGVEVGT